MKHKTTRVASNVLITGFLGLLLHLSSIALAAQPATPTTKAWRISGYVAPSKTKQWLSIESGKIVCIDEEIALNKAPTPSKCTPGTDSQKLKGALEISTQDFIFPGMMDLHNHIEFNSLPLWKEAKGQFKNRFEWRESEPYQTGPHKFFMRLMKLDAKDPDYAKFSDFNCLSLQWAEIKALAGGVTAIQGLGRTQNATCTKDFGIRNLEIASTMGLTDKVIAGAVEVINPESIEKGFNVFIRPYMSNDLSNYTSALNIFNEHFQIQDWLNRFKNEEHTIENGIRLVVGPLSESYLRSLTQKLDKESGQKLLETIITAEAEKLKVSNLENAIARAKAWIFEPFIEKVSYLDIQPGAPETEKLSLAFLSPDRFDRNAMKADGVLHIPRDARDYIASFELGTLVNLRARLAQPKTLSFLTHLGEGRRSNNYNSQEFDYAQSLGLITPNFVSIHGVGFTENNIAEMARRGNGLVVSPFSNLLLYGESVRIKSLIDNNVLLALGSDWSVSGTKNLIDEAQVLKAYAQKEGVEISDDSLAEILTTNPAKILKLDSESGFGKIALGKQADFILVSNQKNSGATSLVKARGENINLVTIQGEPVYGNASLLSKVGLHLGDSLAPESVNSLLDVGTDCITLKKANKAYRLFSWTDKKRVSVIEIQQKLKARFADASDKYTKQTGRQGLGLDPIYSCQDQGYRDTLKNVITP